MATPSPTLTSTKTTGINTFVTNDTFDAFFFIGAAAAMVEVVVVGGLKFDDGKLLAPSP
jgi:hypothetical protein